MSTARTVTRSLGFWAVAAVVAIAVGIALSAGFGKEGSDNDPFLAEIGNVGQLVAAALLVVIGVISAVRAIRGRART